MHDNQTITILSYICIISSYVSIGEHASKPTTSSLTPNQAVTTANLFSILTNSIAECMKNDEETNISVPTTPSSVSGDVKLGSTPSNPSKLSGNDQMSKNSLGLSPECYGYYSSG